METIMHLSGLLHHADQPRNEVPWGEAYNPRCGDVWQLKDGRYAVVDYCDSFCTGITFSDGEARGQRYTQSFGDWLRRQEAKLISSFEMESYPGSDKRGWTADTKAIGTVDQSLAFIKRRLCSSVEESRKHAVQEGKR